MDEPNPGSRGPVTPEFYREWRSPRRGRSNPEILDNPVWEHLIRTGKTAYQAAVEFGEPSSCGGEPAWCFHRFGQSTTSLPDGRQVLVAGEHEDHYDPDFFIYNDVVVRHPDDSIRIFGYPEDVFPPTDFHSATEVGTRIVLVGNLGYPEAREPERTQVVCLELRDFSITSATASGESPGWIHGHRATLSEDGGSLLIKGGEVDRGGEAPLVENIDEWRLWLGDWRWERLTRRRWQRWVLWRGDQGWLRLSQMRSELTLRAAGVHLKVGDWLRDAMAKAGAEIDEDLVREITKGTELPEDTELLDRLYRPLVRHEPLPSREEEHNVWRVRVDDVVVRYVEETASVSVTVEGELPAATVDALKADVLEKLQRLEGGDWRIEEL